MDLSGPEVRTAILTALGALVGWLARYFVSNPRTGLVGRLEVLEAKLDIGASQTTGIEKRLALGTQSFEYLRKSVERIETRLSELERTERKRG